MSDDLVKQALADRIKEHDAAFTNLHREYDRRGDRIEELKAKLAKADRVAKVLNDLLQNRGHCFIPNRIAGREDWDEDATEALKDFKGENDE